MSYAKLTAKKNIENIAILEEIAACILSFEKMHLIALEKLKIAVETHYKLHKNKGSSPKYTKETDLPSTESN